MKVVTRQAGYADPAVTQLAKEIQAGFTRVPDTRICYATNVSWTEPFSLQIPPVVPTEAVRSVPPVSLYLERAVCRNDPTILIAPGGLSWEWQGNGLARIEAATGLNPGERYDLTFVAVG